MEELFKHQQGYLLDSIEALYEFIEYVKSDGILIIKVPNADNALLNICRWEPFVDFTFWKFRIYLNTMNTL